MKQLLFIMLSLLAALSLRAATLSGTVTNVSTGSPLSGQLVYVRDSIFSYTDSTLTNASGNYSFTLPGSVYANRIIVTTYACGAVYTNRHTYTGSSISSSFSVCAPAGSFTLHGGVTLNGAANTGSTKLYLIRKQYDSLLADTVLTAIDSFTTSSGSYTKTYSSLPPGTLLLKAALTTSHPYYSSYVPTYYTSSLVWSNATALTAANFNAATTTNINMVSGTYSGGTGFVGGSVLVGANKTTAVGDPLAGRILILTNSTGVPLTYQYSDTSGKFYFTGLAFGTYKLFGDVWGKSNPALTFTLTSARPSVPNIIFEENSTSFEGHFATATVVSGTPLSSVSVYPNPVTDYLHIAGLDNVIGVESIVLRNIAGTVLYQIKVGGEAQLHIPTRELPAGVYLLQLQAASGTSSYRIVR